MRFVSLLTNSTIILVLQQIVSIWFLVDFFLARESTTANRLFGSEHASTPGAKSTFQRLQTITNDLNSKVCNISQLEHEETFDKIVLIVIDALGASFIPSLIDNYDSINSQNSYRMPFLEEAIHNQQAMGFIAKATTPTVTMPRIKALVSGTNPSFMDIAYNLANDVSDFHDDNILQIAKSKGKSLVFYGDDTWLSLFERSMFVRSKETLSLYASDYTSVDTNVTEMALPETVKEIIDWDFLILHYLGLDHIGHVFGSSKSPLIDDKLIEMDNVIKQIHINMSKKMMEKTLIVVCGDHGMSREGNHGGDTALETATAMIFLPINRPLSSSKPYSNEHISQIDLAVTLSALTSLQTPRMSRGVVIEDLLNSLWDQNSTKTTCAIVNNIMQLVELLDSAQLELKTGFGAQLEYLLNQSFDGKNLDTSMKAEYHKLARSIQSHLLKTVATRSNPLLVIITLSLIMLLSIQSLRKSTIRLLMPLMDSKERRICILVTIAPILLQNSVYFIEVEGTFWTFYSVCVFLTFCLTALKPCLELIKSDIEVFRIILFAITCLITSLWNNTNFGSLFESGLFLPILSVLIMCNFSRQTSKLEGKQSVIFAAVGLCVFLTKQYEETQETEANHITKIAIMQFISVTFIIVATLVNLFVSFRKDDNLPTSIVQKLATSWMWLVLLLSRSRNYPYLVSNVMMEASLNSLANSMRFAPIIRAILYRHFSISAFYNQGNTNLFSSIDVKPAFFAQTSYNILFAVPLVACQTFGSQIYWYLKLFQRVQGEKEQKRMSERASESTILGSTSSSPELIPDRTKDAIKDFVDMLNFLNLSYFMFVCIYLRNHLFIWSVISPKLIYLYTTNIVLRITTLSIAFLPLILNKLTCSTETCARISKKGLAK